MPTIKVIYLFCVFEMKLLHGISGQPYTCSSIALDSNSCSYFITSPSQSEHRRKSHWSCLNCKTSAGCSHAAGFCFHFGFHFGLQNLAWYDTGKLNMHTKSNTMQVCIPDACPPKLPYGAYDASSLSACRHAIRNQARVLLCWATSTPTMSS